MRLALRSALFALTALAGLATVPTRGADARLERPKPLVEMTAAARWRLRPAEAAAVAPAPARGRLALPLPEERRHVRQVYPALVEVR